MEMSPGYMEEAAAAFVRHGFELERTEANLGELPTGTCKSTRYDLTRGANERLVLEVVHHPSDGFLYYLEIAQFHGMRTFSFPLDSWKVRPSSIEIKYYALPDSGLGLSLTFDLAHGALPAES